MAPQVELYLANNNHERKNILEKETKISVSNAVGASYRRQKHIELRNVGYRVVLRGGKGEREASTG